MSETKPYYGDNLTPAQRSRAMRAVKSRDTQPELKLRKALRASGIRGYRINEGTLPGRPDIVFPSQRLAVFVDGGFWHGRQDRVRPGRSQYWDDKIQRTVIRDRENAATLREKGWRVLRLWDDEVLADPAFAARRVVWKLTGYTVAEFFAGIGLVRRAIEDAGFEVIYANDIDLVKRTLYAANFDASHHWLGDIRYVTADEVPTVSLATASFPCTDLSVAGRRNGLSGHHSGTYWEFVRILRDMGERRPSVVLLENVAGLGNSRGGDDLAMAIRGLNELGYCCDLLQLDARRWVPQSRQRVFIVGSTNRLAEAGQWGPDELRPSWISRFVVEHPELSLQAADLHLPDETSSELADIVERFSRPDIVWWSPDRVGKFQHSLSGINRLRLKSLRGAPQLGWRTAYRRTRGGHATWEIRSDSISGCLRTSRGGSSKQAVVEAGRGEVRLRWMTALEYARLMGAPDFRLDHVTPNQALFGLGDAVCVPAITWLAREYLLPLVSGELSRKAQVNGAA